MKKNRAAEQTTRAGINKLRCQREEKDGKGYLEYGVGNMLKNPFTPTGIVAMPGEFFGRLDESQRLERSLAKGSVVISGAVGVGKSSLLEHVRLNMEGFNSDQKGKAVKGRTVVAVGNKDIRAVDDMARLVLQEFVQIDESQKTVEVRIPKVDVVKWKSTEICRYFKEGHHLSVLTDILKSESLKAQLTSEAELFILAIDEADKCPEPLAGFVKYMDTYLGHEGIKNIRFIVTGISPFFHSMVKEAPGVGRIFHVEMSVLPLQEVEALELIETKFKELVDDALASKQEIEIDPELSGRIVQLSGGHPHLIQLLGSYVVEHENEDPDCQINGRDLLGALGAICYEKRDWVYGPLIDELELEGMLEPFKRLLLSAEPSLPTRIKRKKARDIVESERLQWLVGHDILSRVADEYRLNDEFLRVRVIMDEDQEAAEGIEKHLITGGSFDEVEGDWPESWQEKELDEDEE